MNTLNLAINTLNLAINNALHSTIVSFIVVVVAMAKSVKLFCLDA